MRLVQLVQPDRSRRVAIVDEADGRLTLLDRIDTVYALAQEAITGGLDLATLAGARAGLAPEDVAGHARAAAALDVRFGMDAAGEEQVFLADKDVTCELRSEGTGEAASRVAAWQEVRSALLGRQRAFARRPGLVADGRDMGSIVFRDAGLKIYLTASAEERARRRHKQLKQKGLSVSLAALSAEIAERDRRDRTRSVAPLIAVPEAIVVDSTAMSIEEVVARVIELARERFPEAAREN